MQNEGFISIIRGRGIEVTPVTEKDARDILEARIYQEQNNAFLSATRATDDEISEMKNCISKLEENLSSKDGQLLYRIDHEFHKIIARSTKNNWLYRETELILNNYLRFENKSVYNNSIDGRIVFKEHLDILKAIEERNPEKAKKMMNKHLVNSYNRTLKRLWNKNEN